MPARERPTGSVLRLDFAPIRGARVTPQGFLRLDASLGRTGVLTYQTPDGPRRELRLPEEVFKADSLASAMGAVVTDLHPPREDAFITTQNYRKWGVGYVGDDVRQDGNLVRASIVIQDQAVQEMILAGKRREISPGYMCRLDPTAGRYDGIEYDAVQRDIVVNSVGLGPSNWGRQGSEVALRLDSFDATAAIGQYGSNTALGDFVRTTMLARGMTVTQLAEQTGIIAPKPKEESPLLRVGSLVDRSYILREILEGWTPRPSDEQLKALAKVLDCTLTQLLDLIPEELRADSRTSARTVANAGVVDAGKEPLIRDHVDPTTGKATQKKRPCMDPIEIRLDGLTISLPKHEAEVVQKAVGERDAKIKAHTAEQSTLQAKLDGLTEQHAKAKKDLAELPEKLRTEMSARADLLGHARRVLGPDIKLDGKTDRQVREEVLKKLSPNVVLDAKDDTYIAVRFDVALEGFKEPSASEKVRAAVTGGTDPKVARTDAKDDPDPAKARAEMVERNHNAWNTKPAN
jgi:hypothetical protein